MPLAVRNVLVPLGSVVFSFVLVTAAGAVMGGTEAIAPPSPTVTSAPSPVSPQTAPAAPAELANVKIVFEQADGTVAPAPAAGESVTLDITTKSKAGETRVCVAQLTGPWKLDRPWAHIGSGSYCRSFSPLELPVVVKLVHP